MKGWPKNSDQIPRDIKNYVTFVDEQCIWQPHIQWLSIGSANLGTSINIGAHTQQPYWK